MKYHNYLPFGVIFIQLAACAVVPRMPRTENLGFEAYLPAPLTEWTRSIPATQAADRDLFGGGLSTSATYTDGNQTCVITITGNAPKMQGYSMNFSNPAAAELTGARVAYVGEEPIVITAAGEVQTLTNNYLTQFDGDCSYQHKVAYVAAMDFAELRQFDLLDGNSAGEVKPLVAGVIWEARFGGPAKDWGYALAATQDGGLVAAGRTASKGAGLEDLWVIRTDGEGELLWDRSFGGAAIDRGRAVIETSDKQLIVAGATESRGAGEFDAWVMKLDSDANLVWEKILGDAATDWASAVIETRDGGYAVAGYTQDEAGAPYDCLVFKLDANGDLLWRERFGGSATDWANAITETTDGGLVVAGHTESKGAGAADFWALKLSKDGALIWERTFGGPALDYASTVAATRQGGVILAGMTASQGAGKIDGHVLELDASGEVVWSTTLGGAKDDWLRAVLQTEDGYRLAGYTDSQGAGLYDAWILRLDLQGKLMSERTLGGTGNDWARALVRLSDGSFAIAGDQYLAGASEGDVWLVNWAR